MPWARAVKHAPRACALQTRPDNVTYARAHGVLQSHAPWERNRRTQPGRVNKVTVAQQRSNTEYMYCAVTKENHFEMEDLLIRALTEKRWFTHNMHQLWNAF